MPNSASFFRSLSSFRDSEDVLVKFLRSQDSFGDGSGKINFHQKVARFSILFEKSVFSCYHSSSRGNKVMTGGLEPMRTTALQSRL